VVVAVVAHLKERVVLETHLQQVQLKVKMVDQEAQLIKL
jgi:hypothetical protein